MINVTKPFLPPLEEFEIYLKEIWKSGYITNNGPFHQKFEKELCDYLGVKYISLFTNGMLALVTAIRALQITGEVITTPYTFVATPHAIWWNGIKPVFVDIDPLSCNMDVNLIEAAITNQTAAILPVHVYGTPCDNQKIQEIACKNGLKVIYDAAHAFGVKKGYDSILNFGDLSILSFHATKVFNTFEGGAIVCHTAEMKQQIDFLKNFGFADEITVVGPGINAKMNEFQSALGLLQLKYFNQITEKRKKIDTHYRELLNNINGITLLPLPDDVTLNYGYFPIFVYKKEYGIDRDELYEKLKLNNIYARRYFYPLINHFPPYKEYKLNLLVAEKISNEVICLPIYPDLSIVDIEKIVKTIKHYYSGI
jgi:dTDP-4-amino-4,6-dideoxy-D-glucose transaminase